MISTTDLLLPEINKLKGLSQSLAMLDAIIEPEWDSRYFSFDAHWGKNEAMASMRNGSGDGYFILFNCSGAILKGFDHESLMSPYQNNPPRVWPGVLDNVPTEFSAFLSEPAFTICDTTFCIWRTHSDISWQRGNIQFPDAEDPDGSAKLLEILDGNPRTYHRHAEDYYGIAVSISAIINIYDHRPISKDIVTSINEEMSLSDISDDMKEIGY